MAFNEDTRVKIPAILHLCRLGYEYLSLEVVKIDPETNIFPDIFIQSIGRLNPDLETDDIKRLLKEIRVKLDNDDLGHAFYKMLISSSGIRLFDFNNLQNNSLHVVTELTYRNGDEEFRPDITLLFNGMPLAFIEVKKPNNREGLLAERNRINVRFKNKKFKRFINISQLLVFSNNMEYDDDAATPLQGVFYSSTAYNDITFNSFREEEQFDLEKLLIPEDEKLENFVLKDNNLSVIKHSPEFLTNKNPNSPTNRLLTSLFSSDRFAFLLKFGIAYLTHKGKTQKHIMRYPQFFAARAIRQSIENGTKKGIVWHTQGSGKTALAYYCVAYLTDYFQKKLIIPKFYFIVDRIDLLIQASTEFTLRGLKVHTVNNKDELLRNFREQKAVHNLTGKPEITVVNIQKFKDEGEILRQTDYNINTQRVYFLDEVHRSYSPGGSFLANLINSDRAAILLGLTGTPLIASDRRSRDTFGDYIHKYYYNASIADGYTLRLIREGIETKYKMQLEATLKDLEILKGEVSREIIYAHDKFVEPLLDYIIEDFINSRIRFNDHSIGAMVVCDSAPQARRLFDLFKAKYNNEQHTIGDVKAFSQAAEPVPVYTKYVGKYATKPIGSLILHDFGTKESRKDEIDGFKNGNRDILFVFNMLLTGFDAPRLKKLYVARLIKTHNLLQTLTRVNRPYRHFQYGYVVDFADIRQEFEQTNKAYFDELQSELGDEMQNYTNLFKSREEILQEIDALRETLFEFDLQNAEVFSQQISQISDRQTMLQIKKALENARNLFNLIRTYGYFDLLEKVDFKKLTQLYNEASRHLDLLNLKQNIQHNAEATNLINVALEDVVFMFRKISEDEMLIADQLKDSLRKTREAMADNFDQADPQFVSLYDELKRLFQKKNLDEITQEEMKQNIGSLNQIHQKVLELNRHNNNLKAKYLNDPKYARLHKRIIEKGTISQSKLMISNTLTSIKFDADQVVMNNKRVMENEGYFTGLMLKLLFEHFNKHSLPLNVEGANYINGFLVKEYLNEYKGITA